MIFNFIKAKIFLSKMNEFPKTIYISNNIIGL